MLFQSKLKVARAAHQAPADLLRWLKRSAAPSEWLFPRHCALCAAPGAGLCVACVEDARSPVRIGCACCAAALHSRGSSTQLCGACLKRPPAYDATVAAAAYVAPFDQLILALKFHAQLAYTPLFAELLASAISVWPNSASAAGSTALPRDRLDVLVPVPLSTDRLRERGFNQALEIARPLGKSLEIRVDASAAVRVFDTPPQASLRFEARRKNIRGAFAVKAPMQGLRVGVVDDVMTTGSTLHELAKALKKAGAAEVVNLVVARTP